MLFDYFQETSVDFDELAEQYNRELDELLEELGVDVHSLHQKNGDTIGYDEWLNELLDVYKFRIAVISERLNSMPVKTEANECEYHLLKCQLASLQESFDELNARENMQRKDNVTPLAQSNSTLAGNVK